SALMVWPGLRVTNALGRSPHLSSGMAITAHSRTAECLAISWDIAHAIVNHAHRFGDDVGVTLPGQPARLPLERQRIPFGGRCRNCRRAIGLGESVDVDRTEVQLRELCQQRGRRWRPTAG